MKNKVINFYGCSFTDGGGLDINEYFDYAFEKGLTQINASDGTDHLHQYRRENRFSTLVGKHFDCEVNNFAQTGNNNDNIVQKVHRNLSDNRGDIHIVQFSFYSRQKVYFDDTGEFYRLNSLETLKSKKLLYNYYKSFIRYHYKVEYEQYKVKMYIDMLDSYVKSKSKTIYWMFWDIIPNGMFKYKDVDEWTESNGEFEEGTLDLTINTDNLISFPPDGYMQMWAKVNKLLISGETDGKIDDCHLSQKGNGEVAKIIIEVLS